MKSNPPVMLVAPVYPEPSSYYFGPPYGLALLSAALKKQGRDVICFDFERKNQEYQSLTIRQNIEKENPRFIGISIQSSSRHSAYQLIKEIKAFDPAITVIVGGPFATVKYQMLLDNFPVDFVVRGEGEFALSELIDALEGRGDPEKVEGVVSKRAGRLTASPLRRTLMDLDILPYPDFDAFGVVDEFDSRGYFSAEKEFIACGRGARRPLHLRNRLMLLSSRGCPYSCLYCPESLSREKRIRFHSEDYFVSMIKHCYQRYTIKDFAFGDNFFTANRERTVSLCQNIIDSGLEITWSCMTRSDYVDRELLRLMSRAGCIEIVYGVESGSPAIQRSIAKSLDLNKTISTFEHTKNAGIRSQLMLMVGNPGESAKTMQDTRTYVQQIDADEVVVAITRLYPGTKLHDMKEVEDIVSDEYYLSGNHHAPFFVAEHGEDQLNAFKNLIQTRRVFIYGADKCNNHCSCCRIIEGKMQPPSSDRIKQSLKISSERSDDVIFSGGEILLREDALRLIRYAKSINISRVSIETNGRMLCYLRYCLGLKKAGVENVILPFWVLDASTHDRFTMVKGAWEQTLQGIENCRRIDLGINVNIFIHNGNEGQLLAMTEFLFQKGAKSFRYIFSQGQSLKLYFRNLPHYSRCVHELEKVKKFLHDKSCDFSLEGFPPCVLGALRGEKLGDMHYLFDEVIDFAGNVIKCSEIRRRDKLKLHFCSACEHDQLCEGIWKDYYAQNRRDIDKTQKVA